MKYAVQYIDRLLEGDSCQDLVELSSVICSSKQYVSTAANYGLPTFAFIFVEALLYFTQANRSGVWTYYEATPLLRQIAMAKSLHTHELSSFAEWYERGMRDWNGGEKIGAVDAWIRSNESIAAIWLRTLAQENRELILTLT